MNCFSLKKIKYKYLNKYKPSWGNYINMLVLVFLMFTTKLIFGVNINYSKLNISYFQNDEFTISGTITDDKGNKIPGVTVRLKNNSNRITTSNLNGQFVLNVYKDAILEVSLLGYVSQEVKISTSKIYDFTLLEADANEVEEVVVTAFGEKSTKANLVSSVSTVSPKDLRSASSNLTSALQGRVAGIVSFQRSGEPGADNADFFIRGVGTFGTNNRPLILIDNVEVTADDLARIPVDDIENFSVLRDAAAASVYGSRGANGVILVTTKVGREGPVNVAVRSEYRISTPTENIKFANPVTWMQKFNEAVITRDPLGVEPYSQFKIEKTAEGSSPLLFPAVDWLDVLTKKTTTTQNHNLTLSGGGQLATYFVSGNYVKDNGLLKMNKLNNFNNNVNFQVMNFRSNTGINLTTSTFLMVRAIVNLQNYTGPPKNGSEVYNLALRANPVSFLPVYEPTADKSYIKHPLFGNVIDGSFNNPYAAIMRGYSERRRSNVQIQLELKQDLSQYFLQGLKYRGLANFIRNSFFSQARNYNPFYYEPIGINSNGKVITRQINPAEGTEYLSFEPNERNLSSVFYFENQISYNKLFKEKHNINAFVINTLRNSLSTPVDNNITLISTLPNRNISFSGSATYSYDDRYNALFSFGYNGSEKFSEEFRWGFFPSFGLSWVVSGESFFTPLKDVVNNLKFRFTAGKLGNDNINNTRFFYLSDVNLNSGAYGYVFGMPNDAGRRSLNGVVVNRYANPNIGWEVSNQLNLGMELGLFNGVFNLTADIFRQKRDNIVQTRNIASSSGLTANVLANVGKYKSQGVDLEVNFNKTLNSDFWIQGRGTFTFATGEYVFFEEPTYKDGYRSKMGTSSSHQFGYIAERLFIDDKEVYNSPEQTMGSVVFGGDIKYLDVNRDGIINDDDQMAIGYPTTPEINFGFGLSTGYKNFDFSFFFSGIGRTSLFINPTTQNTATSKGVAPFGSATSPNAMFQSWVDSYWSENNKDVYAAWPRLSVTPQSNNTAQSTFWLRDGSLLRLRQVEIAYSLNKNFLKRYLFKSFRIYASGTNLFKWSSFKLWDPEMGGDALNYPLQKVFNIGINANL